MVCHVVAVSIRSQGERRPGFVGLPLPGVQVKIVPHADQDSSSSSSRGTAAQATMSGVAHGELAVRGPMLFREYWGRPEASAAAFDAEGYFLTGDTVSLEGEPPYYKVKLLAAAVQACEAWGGGSIAGGKLRQHLFGLWFEGAECCLTCGAAARLC